jgi:Flp pilus assembly pilin Flp
LRNGEEGQNLIEYAQLGALIALSAVLSVNHLASQVTRVFSNVSASLA